MELFRTHIKPPTPVLTEKNLPDQSGKIFLVTGASGGVGEQLAGILYGANATIYVAARSAEKANKAIEGLKAAHPNSTGRLVFLHLDLADLPTIKKSADEFLAAESKLDVMIPPQGSKTTQGYELQLGTNNLGHFLFVKYLRDVLRRTAITAPKNSVRVIWVSSSAAQLAPNPPIDFDNLDYKRDESAFTKYARSKAGNVLHSCEFARRTEGEGILSLSLNPGNLESDLQRHVPIYQSQEITEKNQAGWFQPWGRLQPIRKELADPEYGRKFWEWSEEQVKTF